MLRDAAAKLVLCIPGPLSLLFYTIHGLYNIYIASRGCGSVGRATAWRSGGSEFIPWAGILLFFFLHNEVREGGRGA